MRPNLGGKLMQGAAASSNGTMLNSVAAMVVFFVFFFGGLHRNHRNIGITSNYFINSCKNVNTHDLYLSANRAAMSFGSPSLHLYQR